MPYPSIDQLVDLQRLEDSQLGQDRYSGMFEPEGREETTQAAHHKLVWFEELEEQARREAERPTGETTMAEKISFTDQTARIETQMRQGWDPVPTKDAAYDLIDRINTRPPWSGGTTSGIMAVSPAVGMLSSVLGMGYWDSSEGLKARLGNVIRLAQVKEGKLAPHTVTPEGETVEQSPTRAFFKTFQKETKKTAEKVAEGIKKGDLQSIAITGALVLGGFYLAAKLVEGIGRGVGGR